MKIFILFAFCIVLQINDATALYWVHASNGNIPSEAILSGSDKGSVPMYTCRAWYNSDLIPGKLTTANKGCMIAYNGLEVKITEYDVAVGDGAFFPTIGTSFQIYIHSAEGGIVTSKSQFLYICRAKIEGNLSVGKLEDTKCWISYGGYQQTFEFGQYEVLTHENDVVVTGPVFTIRPF